MAKDECVIRSAGLNDADKIAGLCVQLGYDATGFEVVERLSRLRNRDDIAAFVAEEEGNIVGWIQAGIRTTIESGDSVEIMGLVVDETRRGKGIGGLLVRRVEEWGESLNCPSIRVRTNVVRNDARSFYRRLGFEESKQQVVFSKRLPTRG